MKEPLKSSLSHVLLGIPIFWIGWVAAAFLPFVWVGFLANVLWWGSRELAQSFRPSAPTKLNWTWTNTWNFAMPVGVALLFALGITVFW